jgi:hypothetical protein
MFTPEIEAAEASVFSLKRNGHSRWGGIYINEIKCQRLR